MKSFNVRDAGIRLLRAVRDYGTAIPFVIYCCRRAVRAFEKEAVAAGVTAITVSTAVLAKQLHVAGVQRP
jgi:hypothetical protein